MKRLLGLFLVFALISFAQLPKSGGSAVAGGSGTGNVTTSATLTANLPVFGNGGVDVIVGTKSGNTNVAVTTTGAQTSGRCVEIDASGNHVQSAAGCNTSGTAVLPFTVVRTNSTTLTIGTECSASAPCNYQIGSTVYTLSTPATAVISAGTADVFIYFDILGVLTVGDASNTIVCTTCTHDAAAITAFPNESSPIYLWTVTTATFDASGGTDYRSTLNFGPRISSTTLTVTPTATGYTINQIATVIASGTATLGTSAISANACATVVTVSATGTLTSHVIAASFTADTSAVTGYGPLSTDGLYITSYPSANNVNFKVCNGSGASITPGAATLNWRVL